MTYNGRNPGYPLRKAAALFLLAASVILQSSCSDSLDKNFDDATVAGFFDLASRATPMYGDEPSPGTDRPFPASFVITGKLVIISKPVFDDSPAMIPGDAYRKYSFADYKWYTDDPSEVRYVVLIEQYIEAEGPFRTLNSILFTIVDLSYGEQVYKAILPGCPDSEALPYRELAEILESLVL
ncbi:MAG: hypothetical protein JXB33_08960 [Clostridia bacterium]|nr:hypothetical protein [Clostridia bacterium]